MSKRSERREAERLARKLAYKQSKMVSDTTAEAPSSAPQATINPQSFNNIATPAEVSDTTPPPHPLDLGSDTTLKTPSSDPEITSNPQSVNNLQNPEMVSDTKNPISAAQLAANRANSQHSTGPRTTTGRAASSQNSLKHGLTAKTAVLPTESAEDYQHQLNLYIDIHSPATEEEHRLVRTINDCIWRLARVQQIETSILYKAQLELAEQFPDRNPLERTHMITADAYMKYEKQIRNLNVQEARLNRTMDKAKDELTRLQTLRQREEAERAALQATLEARARQSQSSKPAQSATANGFVFSTGPNAPAAARNSGHQHAKSGTV